MANFVFALSQLQGVEWRWPGRREPDDEHSPGFVGERGIASSSFVFYVYWYSYIGYFVCDSASEFGAMGFTSFLGFSYPNLLLVFLSLLFLGTCIIFLSQVLGLSLGLFLILSLFFCILFWVIVCDHGNSFLCLEDCFSFVKDYIAGRGQPPLGMSLFPTNTLRLLRPVPL